MTPGMASRRVAEWVHDVGWEDLSATVRCQAVRCLLDLCGSAIGGSRTRVARIAAEYARAAHGTGSATIVGQSGGSSAVGGALANGFAASALDVDDGYRPVKGHPGAIVFPSVLAAAEQVRATGADFLLALVIGYEVAMRAGLILHPLYDFYHGSGAWGPIGGAAGAARMLGLDVERTWQALGIAEFHAPMTPEMRSVEHPSMLKDGIGWGAMVGLASAQLAAHGFTGIPSLFDSPPGEGQLPGAAGERIVPNGLVESLGHDYLMLDVYYKPYACCRWAQPAIDGALQAVRALGVEASDVARVRVHTFEAALHLGRAHLPGIPFTAIRPRTTEEAQFSVAWPVAAALIDGAVGPEQILEAALARRELRELAARIELAPDAELEACFPTRALARVVVETFDGRSASSAVLAARGDGHTPLSDVALLDKLAGLAAPVLGAERTARLADVIQALPSALDLTEFTSLLGAAEPVGAGEIRPRPATLTVGGF